MLVPVDLLRIAESESRPSDMATFAERRHLESFGVLRDSWSGDAGQGGVLADGGAAKCCDMDSEMRLTVVLDH